MTITTTDITASCGLTLEANQSVFQVVDTPEVGSPTTVYAKITTTADKQAGQIKWTMRPMIIDGAGAYLEVGGEPVMLPAAEHTFKLGEAAASPTDAKTLAFVEEAERAYRYYTQLLDLAAI